MSESNYLIILIGVFLAILYHSRDKANGGVRLPKWLWTVIGLFLLFMSIRHAKEVIDFIVTEADAWWPIVKSSAQKVTTNLRNLFVLMKEGAK